MSIDITTNDIPREEARWPSNGRPILFSCQNDLLAMFSYKLKSEEKFNNIDMWHIGNMVWKYEPCLLKWMKYTKIPPFG